MLVFIKENHPWVFPKCSAAFPALSDCVSCLLAILFDIIKNWDCFIVTDFPPPMRQKPTAVSFLALFLSLDVEEDPPNHKHGSMEWLGLVEITYFQPLPLGQHEWKHGTEAHTTISEFLAWRYMERSSWNDPFRSVISPVLHAKLLFQLTWDFVQRAINVFLDSFVSVKYLGTEREQVKQKPNTGMLDRWVSSTSKQTTSSSTDHMEKTHLDPSG